jgi:Autotransporter beta-domain
VATARRRARATGTGTIAGLSEDTKPEPLSGRMACRPSAAVVAGALDRRAGSGWSRQHLGHRRPARSGGQVDVDSSRMVWQPYVQANIWRDWGGKAETMFGVDSVSLIEQVTRLEFAGGITVKLARDFSLYAQGGYRFADESGPNRTGAPASSRRRWPVSVRPPSGRRRDSAWTSLSRRIGARKAAWRGRPKRVVGPFERRRKSSVNGAERKVPARSGRA